MFRLEVFRNGELIITEYCVDWKHLRSTMLYYTKVNPELKCKLYNDITEELIDGYCQFSLMAAPDSERKPFWV